MSMHKTQRFILTVVVVSAPLVSAAPTVTAGFNLANHNETLLQDA